MHRPFYEENLIDKIAEGKLLVWNMCICAPDGKTEVMSFYGNLESMKNFIMEMSVYLELFVLPRGNNRNRNSFG